MALVGLMTIHHGIGKQAVALPDSTDFYKFLISAERVNNGESPYWMPPPRQKVGDPCHPSTPPTNIQFKGTVPDALLLTGDDPCLGPNLNPPIFVALVRPFRALTFAQAWWTWMALSLLGAAVGMGLLMREIASTTQPRWIPPLLGTIALLAYYPTLANVSLGQVGTLLLPPLVLAWRTLRHQAPLQAGLWIGILVAFKPFLAILWLGLLLIKQWRAFAIGGAVILVLSALGWMLFGTQVHQHYALIASDVTWNGANWNASWAGLTERFFSGQTDSVLPQGSLQARTSAALLSVLTLGFAARGVRQASGTSRDQVNAWVTWAVPASLLISPLGWIYYFPLMALPWMLLWQRAKALQATASQWPLLTLIPVVLSSITLALGNSPRPQTPTVWWGVDSIYCYALVAFLLITQAIQHKSHSQKNRAPG